LDHDVLLNEQKAAFSRTGNGGIPVFVDGPFGQGNTVRVAYGDQPSQKAHANSKLGMYRVCRQFEIEETMKSNETLGKRTSPDQPGSQQWFKAR
jgi:hypothetical protein